MKADKTAKYSPQRGYKNPQDVFNKRSRPIKKNITSVIIRKTILTVSIPLKYETYGSLPTKKGCAKHSPFLFYKESVIKFLTYYSSIRTDEGFQITISPFHLNDISEARRIFLSFDVITID